MLATSNNAADTTIPSYLPPADASMGTTILACKFSEGVVVCADSRTSYPTVTTGRASRKITPISDRVAVCRCGSAADTENIMMYVKRFLEEQRLELMTPEDGTLPLPHVRAAAGLFRLFCYNYKDQLQAGMLCAGWDPYEGPQLYSLPLGGAIFQQNLALDGSGSRYIAGLADSLYRPDFTKAEALDFVIKLVAHAMARDSSSGGMIRYAIITKEKYEEGFVRGDALPTGPL